MSNRGAVVVTGGSRGIGAAISRRLAADGYGVLVNYARDAASADVVVADILAKGGQAVAHRADMADPTAIAALFEAADSALGPLVGIVANAGIIGETDRRFDAQDATSLMPVLTVNILAPMLCAAEAVRRLSTKHGGKGGAIVLLSSVAARTGIPGAAAYSASKGAVESFVRALGNEVAREGVRVNAVAPGMVETDMTAGFAAKIAPMIPIGRCGRPEEIAAAVAWLLSEEASYVTGATMTVAGGR